MTLKELRGKVKETGEKFHLEQMENGCYEIAAQAQLEDALLMVSKTGTVMYKTGRHFTTFPLSQCGGYVYYTADDDRIVVQESDFESMDWTVRLLMEGEKRIAENMDRAVREHETTDGLGAEQDVQSILDNDKRLAEYSGYREPLSDLIEREDFENLIAPLTENRKLIARKLYLENKSDEQVARETGKSYNAIRHADQQLRKALRKKLEKK